MNKWEDLEAEDSLDEENTLKSKSDVPAGAASKNWYVTFGLSVFLGPLGADRFYTGHVKLGALKLALFLVANVISKLVFDPMSPDFAVQTDLSGEPIASARVDLVGPVGGLMTLARILMLVNLVLWIGDIILTFIGKRTDKYGRPLVKVPKSWIRSGGLGALVMLIDQVFPTKEIAPNGPSISIAHAHNICSVAKSEAAQKVLDKGTEVSQQAQQFRNMVEKTCSDNASQHYALLIGATTLIILAVVLYFKAKQSTSFYLDDDELMDG